MDKMEMLGCGKKIGNYASERSLLLKQIVRLDSENPGAVRNASRKSSKLYQQFAMP